jgi:hypothetical protein
MTLDDLTHIFRFQTTADIDYAPKDVVDYLLLEGQNRIPGQHDAHDLDSLVILLDNFEFEGYRDRTPIFVKPDPFAG